MGQLKVAPKLRVPFEGPHLVTNAISKSLYLIQLNKKGTRKVVHHNLASCGNIQRKPEAELGCICTKEDEA